MVTIDFGLMATVLGVLGTLGGLAAGVVKMIQRLSAVEARLTESAVVEGPCAFFAVGAPGRFDNHIHRITCLSDTGHSLHVYSDDALRGEVYREE